MKFNLNWGKKEVSAEADIENVIIKNMEIKKDAPQKKTRYQIKQEEKRKNQELRHKQQMTYIMILGGICILLMIFAIIASVLGI